MDMHFESDCLLLRDESGRTVGEVTFPAVGQDVVNINHTFVHPSLRGRGVAGTMMRAVAERLRGGQKRAVLSCGYARAWFTRHPEYRDVEAKEHFSPLV